MLNIAFGQSKYFIDNLSENVKRGLRQKLRRGEWPGWAAIGYLNDLRTHTIIVDPDKHKLVLRIFERYATGEYTFKDLATFAREVGLMSRGGRPLSISQIQFMLKNPFYCGVFRFNGELYEAKHEPIVSQKLFDQVQAVMAKRGRAQKTTKHDYTFKNVMHCGACSASITAEQQKGHVYYRCTKKIGPCTEKYLREEALVIQLRALLDRVSMPIEWADKMLNKLQQEETDQTHSAIAVGLPFKQEIAKLDDKLERLLDAKLEGLITSAEYANRKEKLIKQKLLASEKLTKSQTQGNRRLEPLKYFLRTCQEAQKVATAGDSLAIRSFLKNVGSLRPCEAQGAKWGTSCCKPKP
jgi:hypothetical protein